VTVGCPTQMKHRSLRLTRMAMSHRCGHGHAAQRMWHFLGSPSAADGEAAGSGMMAQEVEVAL
jgi:hypothetical protein